MYFFIWAILFLCCISTYGLRTPLVNTSYGAIRGTTAFSRDNREYFSFVRIPFAKPPVGNLRFAEPQKPDPWDTPLSANGTSPVCIQRNYLFSHNPTIEGEEDCLYLNVFVPKLCLKEDNPRDKIKLFPVMVFIHWGAFIAGRGGPDYLSPSYFMDKNIILVTLNYRLGPFGFLSTLDDEAPGNYGLKDQVAALKWVQQNIEHFGGNKNRVTIFGQSAGAGSTHYHLLSPSSKGLFHQAISQSGSALAPWALPLNSVQKQVTTMQANFVGCGNNSGNNSELIRCLRNVPASEILKTQDDFRPFYGNPLMTFASVIETKTEKNKNPFLTKTPLEYISSGEFRNVPWMTGVVQNEGVLGAGTILRAPKIREELNKNFESILTDVLLAFSFSTEDPHGLYKNVTRQYLGGKDFVDVSNKNSVQGFVDLYSDRVFKYPLYQSVLFHAAKGHKPIYVYSFEYDGAYTYGDLFAITDKNIDFDWGTSHCDDLLYLFYSPKLFPKLKKWNDINLSNKMVNFWTNFAIYGNPNPPENLVHSNINWCPIKVSDDMNNDNIKLLNITGNSEDGASFEITSGFYKERMKFWTDSNLFENFEGLN